MITFKEFLLLEDEVKHVLYRPWNYKCPEDRAPRKSRAKEPGTGPGKGWAKGKEPTNKGKPMYLDLRKLFRKQAVQMDQEKYGSK